MNTNQNQNVLDAIVNAQAGFDGGAHSFQNGARITESAISLISAGISAGAYRGQGIDVRKANNDPQAIMDIAGMNWKTVKMPLAIQGKSEYRPFPGMNALVRSDNGFPLAVATDDYKPHHNGHLVKTMCDFANESGLELSRVGLFDGGKRGFAVATSSVNREAKVGDVVAMHIILRFGHAPGTATSYRAMALELRCSNGATFEVAGGRARFVHSAELTPGRIAEAREFVQNAARAFNGHVDKLAKLRTVKSNVTLDLMQLTELFQPELAKRIAEALVRPTTAVAGDTQDHSILGARVLDAIMTRDASRGIVAGLIQDGADRLLNKVIEATMTQPGGEMTVGTLAHAYSGVTNFNSNLRGRSAETGLEANLFGTYQNDSHRALELAVNVAGAMGRMN